MSRLALIFSLFVVVIVAGVSAQGHGFGLDQPATFVCTADGYFADHGRNCVAYYRCENGERTGLGCRDGFRFDEKVNKCRPAALVPC